MAEKLLGPVFEIHGGGLDLRFPHHENELAQSRGAGREFARLWAHNGMLELAAEKMSKSLGNIVSLRDVLDEYGREAILLLFLGAHYRSPVEYSDEAMRAATSEAERFRNYFRGSDRDTGGRSEWQRLAELLDDDFNTPAALALMHDWRARGLAGDLARAVDLFGLSSLAATSDVPDEIDALADRRQRAREAGDFAESDRLRDEITAAGWEVRDTPDGYDLFPLG
jgi:cysteinyl-tRNA synthetase